MIKSMSELEIEKWSRIIDKTGKDGIERLNRYIGSLALGRNFKESFDSYLERRELTVFYNWYSGLK